MKAFGCLFLAVQILFAGMGISEGALSFTAYAASTAYTGTPEDSAGSTPALIFTPQGDGAYIFSNNPETIKTDDIANGKGERNWLMRNPGLGSGKYTLAMYHHTELGYELTVDAEFYSQAGANITVTNIGVQRPDSEQWASIDGYADYCWITNGRDINTSGAYGRRSSYNLPKTYYRQGDRVWLSQIYRDVYETEYPRIGGSAGAAPLFVMIDFTIDGTVDVNTLAYTGTPGAPQNINWSGEAGYVFDLHHKGISPSLPQVNANLEFVISDETHPDGTNLTVKTVNTANPNGNETYEWATHVNPQENPSCINVGAESDLLPLYYSDSSKQALYGEAAQDDSSVRNTWSFDVHRTQIRTPYVEKNNGRLTEPSVVPDPPAGFKPNGLLTDSSAIPAGMEAYEVAVPLGNWGVIENYTVTIHNTGRQRYLTYRLDCDANVILNKFDGYLLSPRIGNTSYARWFNLGPIAPGSNVINFSVVMPTADNGWFRNQLIISDAPATDR